MVVTVGALAVAAVHLMRPAVKIDGVLLGLLAVAIIPWLGSIFESVEGAGLKVTYRRLREELDSTRSELEATKEKWRAHASGLISLSRLESATLGPVLLLRRCANSLGATILSAKT